MDPLAASVSTDRRSRVFYVIKESIYISDLCNASVVELAKKS